MAIFSSGVKKDKDYVVIRVAVLGNKDAEKSILRDVLTHRELEMQKGEARLKTSLKDESSTVKTDILGFDSKGELVNRTAQGPQDWAEISEEAKKVVEFMYCVEGERNVATTIRDMSERFPDYAMLLFENSVINDKTEENLRLAMALQIPIFAVLTKIDDTKKEEKMIQKKFRFVMKKLNDLQIVPIWIKDIEDVVQSATEFIETLVKGGGFGGGLAACP